MKDDATFMFTLKKIMMILAIAFFCFPLYPMQRFTDLDKINSSLEKPKLSFDLLEKGIASLERISLQLSQELASLKQQLNDLKAASKMTTQDFKQPSAKVETQANPSVAESQKMVTENEAIQQPTAAKMNAAEYPLDNG